MKGYVSVATSGASKNVPSPLPSGTDTAFPWTARSSLPFDVELAHDDEAGIVDGDERTAPFETLHRRRASQPRIRLFSRSQEPEHRRAPQTAVPHDHRRL